VKSRVIAVQNDIRRVAPSWTNYGYLVLVAEYGVVPHSLTVLVLGPPGITHQQTTVDIFEPRCVGYVAGYMQTRARWRLDSVRSKWIGSVCVVTAKSGLLRVLSDN